MSQTVKEIIAARSDFDPDSLDAVITLATELTSDCYSKQKNYAIALMTMHMASLGKAGGNQSNGQTGSIKSEKEGQLQLTYGFHASMEIKDPWLAQTSYGLELMGLRDSILVLPMNRFTNSC